MSERAKWVLKVFYLWKIKTTNKCNISNVYYEEDGVDSEDYCLKFNDYKLFFKSYYKKCWFKWMITYDFEKNQTKRIIIDFDGPWRKIPEQREKRVALFGSVSWFQTIANRALRRKFRTHSSLWPAKYCDKFYDFFCLFIVVICMDCVLGERFSWCNHKNK